MGPPNSHPLKPNKSEQMTPHHKPSGSRLLEILAENNDSSGYTVEEGSERVDLSPKSTRTSSTSFSVRDDAREIYELRARNEELQAEAFEQRIHIEELENKVEVLFDEFREKEQEATRALNSNAVYEKRLQEMATLESEKYRLILQFDTLRQVIQEQAESLEAMSLDDQLGRGRQSSTHLIMNLMGDTNDNDIHIEELQQKINELSHVVNEKDKEINDLNQMLHSKEIGLMEFESKMDEKCRRQTNVEDKLTAKSREMETLIHRASILQDTVENRNHELQAIHQELEAEKEATRIVRVEKETVVKKYKQLARDKASKDKTFMHLYDDELVPAVQFSEADSELNYSEDCWVDYGDVGSQGYFALQFDQHQTRRKSKPNRAPPPIPNQSVTNHNAGNTKGKLASPEDETKRLNQADYEYFLMSSIAVRMNLAAQYNKDEIMAVELAKLWEVCRKSQIPMNKYYFYIEDALRVEFNLPELSNSQVVERPPNANCCILM